MCARVDCTTKGVGVWHPMLLFLPHKKYGDVKPVEMTIGVAICDACKPRVKMQEFLSPKQKDFYRAKLLQLKLAPPKFGRTRLNWVKVDDYKGPGFESAERVPVAGQRKQTPLS